ncbi:hypothetical protein EJB05_06079 [Eragrostis curvula]|uniref:Uncharacterized protein n=1 Tax=Eragrostis curvula TaxID=38414 RepID=A0A5J9WEA8_9POAL|nr:hypothetical protein EJB05_06079 [Eragrostis curvula]
MNIVPSLLSRRRICQLLQAFRDKQRVKDEKHYTHPDACRYVLNKFQVRDGYCLGYPMPPRGDMILVNTFEEPFGDAYPKGVWTTVRETVRSTIDQIIVSLASFKGNTRFFACTGFFIDFDENVTTVMTSASLVRHPERPMEIVEGLEIKVLLPSKQQVEGTLKHYSLRYNVALISVKNFHALHTVNLDYKTANISSPFVTTRLDHTTRDATLVAVGRCFESGVVMAASGNPVYGSGSLHCRLLFYSSCKITKAGIGGPLVDLDGNFIGMNFYDCHIGNPFMLHVDLCGVLKYLKTKETTYDRGFDVSNIDLDDNGKSVRWPLLKPHWCHPDCLKEDDMPHYERGRIRVGRRKYAYKLGRLTLLK